MSAVHHLAGSGPFHHGEVVQERYRIEEQLGIGGMGVVYRVTDLVQGRMRALKSMRTDLGADLQELIRKQFEIEAEALSRIESEFVVRIWDAHCEHGEPPYVVMDLLVGQDLGALLRVEGHLEPSFALYLLRQLAAGLEALHLEGLVHRDVKPENLFITARADHSIALKIVDFSIAKLLNVDMKTTLAKGTPGYMAPEQLVGKGIDHRTDVYALGLVARDMLFGLSDESVDSKGRDATVVDMLDGFTPWFERTTAPEPQGRYATAVEAVDELAHALGIPATVAHSFSVPPVVGSRRQSGVRSTKGWLRVGVLVAASGALTVGSLALVARSRTSSPPQSASAAPVVTATAPVPSALPVPSVERLARPPSTAPSQSARAAVSPGAKTLRPAPTNRARANEPASLADY